MDHAPLSDLLKEDPKGLTSDPAFLAGDGEMGERIRSFDWGGTSIGPIESWSPALQSTVSIMLANRFPMLLWWGPQFLSIYNDAYAPILGAKHPTALGLPVSECWSEIWHILKPLIETPFQGGPSTWIEDLMMEVNRHGFAEEGHWTVAYSPVPDETAPRGIGGVLATVHEITEKVIAERRVAAMRDLGTKATEAKTAEDACTISAEILAMYAKDIPFALLYLIDSERKLARLTATAGVRAHLRMSHPIIDLAAQTDDPQPWPLTEVMHTEEMKVVDNVTDEFGTEAPAGTWFDPPRQAVVVPIRSNTVHQLAGFLVAGVSIRLQLDGPYRNFYQFVAGQIATAIANARAHEEERKRADALAELDRTQTAFFSNVSHELRTPLTLMLGPLEELKAQFGCSRSSLDASQYRQVDVVHRNGLRLLKLVNQLLDFSRIGAGRAQALYEETDVAAFTADLSAELRGEQPLSPNHSGLSTHDSALSKTRQRILLADDNADMREYAHRLLSAQGYEVESVADGQAALDCVQANPPDIVLTDVMMPRLDGFGLLQALRADERTRTLPIIMLSARAGEEARAAGLRAGADDYLVKPFSARELPARVRSQLELARLRRENEERVSGILDSITDGFQTIGADYRFKYFNEAARRTYIEQGINPDEQIGRHIFDEVFPAERDKPWAVSLCRTMSKRIPTQAEIFHEPWQRWFAARFDPAPDGGVSVFFQDITERKQAEKALRESEERQAFLLALSDALRPLTAPADIAGPAAERLGERFDLNRVFYAEIAGSRMTVERDYARNVGSIVGEHNLEAFGTAMLAAYRDGAVITVNDVGVEPRLNEEARVGLRLRQVGAYVDVVLFQEEQKVGLLALQSATSRDWTAAEQNLFREVGERVKSAVERARAEEALRQSERETKRARDYAEATLRTSPIPLLVLEKDLRVNTANVAFYQTFQVNPAETEGRLVYALGNGQWNIPKLRELLENILPQHTVFRGFEVTHDFESIGRRTMLLNARRMDNEPDIPERIVLVIEDITDRKQSEEAKARLAAIVASSDDAIISKNLQGIITSWNKGAEKIFGYAAAETIGRSIMMLIPPQRVDEEPKNLASIRRGETVAHYETVRRRKDGTDIDISLTISPVRDETGNIIGASKIARDISERKRAEEALRRLNDELEQRVTHRTRDLVQSQDRLRAMATELNLAEQRERKRLATELHDHLQQTLVLGRLLVGQGKRAAVPVPACLDVMKKMDDIFSEALTYTRTLVADLSPPVLRDHGLPAGLKWLGEYMKKHEITVTVTVPETDALKLPEDQTVLLFQSVRELLINSSKHAGTKQADIRLERYDGQLRIEVSDQGVGFDLAAAAAAAAGTPNGGISSKFGLFSIQERMHALGGTFEVQSAPGQGTTATLFLPLARSTEAKVLSAELSGESSALKSQDSALPGCSVLGTQDSAHQQHAEIRVLLVDDHPMMRQGLRSIVTAYEHFEVVGEAGDGAEAVELAQRLNPDVVVMDIDMPKMDGIEATQQIKANQPATAVIGLSVNRSADTEQKMKEAGASAYLTKESAVDALCHAIEQAVSSTQHVASAGPTSSRISSSDRSGTVTGT